MNERVRGQGSEGLLKKEVIFDTCNENDSSKTTRNNKNTRISLRSMAVFVGRSTGRRCAPNQKGSMFIKRKINSG